MTDPATAFGKMFPGFDFLQGLTRNASAALPHFNQWVAPTLNPEEIDKRIDELKTVQFWLDQNARLIGTTIQALEVQRMTLSTLKTMNVSFTDMADAMKIRMPAANTEAPPAAERRAATPSPAPATGDGNGRPPEPAEQRRDESSEGGGARPGAIDPMQWWGALTKQFTDLASAALKDGSADAARELTSSMVKRGIDAASESFKAAAAMPTTLARSAADAAARSATAGSASGGPAAEASGGAKSARRTAHPSAAKTAKAGGPASPAPKAAARKAAKPAED